jgi:rod shape determining protein RodA
MIIILLQNETGSALVFASFALVLYREGLPGWILVGGVGMAILAVLLYYFLQFISSLHWPFYCHHFFIFRRTISLLIFLTIVIVALSSIYVSTVNYAFENVLQAHQRTG